MAEIRVLILSEYHIYITINDPRIPIMIDAAPHDKYLEIRMGEFTFDAMPVKIFDSPINYPHIQFGPHFLLRNETFTEPKPVYGISWVELYEIVKKACVSTKFRAWL